MLHLFSLLLCDHRVRRDSSCEQGKCWEIFALATVRPFINGALLETRLSFLHHIQMISGWPSRYNSRGGTERSDVVATVQPSSTSILLQMSGEMETVRDAGEIRTAQ
jgi:hypothetical protein